MEYSYLEVGKMFQEVDINFKYDCLHISVEIMNAHVFNPNETIDFHSHTNFEFHYIKEGVGTLILNDNLHQLEKGDFYITGPGVVHKQIAGSDEPMVEYALRFDGKINLESPHSDKSNTYEYVHMLDILSNSSGYVIKDKNEIERLFELCFDELYHRRTGYFSQIQNQVVSIIIAAVRNYDDKLNVNYDVPKRHLNNFRIKSIRKYVASNCTRYISSGEIARFLYISEKQLSRVVKQETGHTLHNFITSCRIELVKQLLDSTDSTLKEIAEKTGFSSEFHLSNTFKQWVGKAPSKYRTKDT